MNIHIFKLVCASIRVVLRKSSYHYFLGSHSIDNSHKNIMYSYKYWLIIDVVQEYCNQSYKFFDQRNRNLEFALFVTHYVKRSLYLKLSTIVEL